MAELVYLDKVVRKDNSVITVGTFDGVHKGHRAIMDAVVRKAKERGARSVIVTFDPHPREIISPGDDGIRLLTTLQERCEILKDLGVDLMVVIPFDRDFSLLTSEDFVEDVVFKKIGVSEFVIGYDHHFGRNREGTIETLERLGKKLGFDTYVVSKKEVGHTTVSSTKIREALTEKGDVQLARQLLGRYYMLNGTVVHGDKRGKKIGFPTANITPEHPKKIIPRNGVYAVKLRVDGEWHSGMMNIGVRPTFDGSVRTLEAHLFNFDQDIYGKMVQIRFVDHIRNEVKFDGVDQLISRLEKDREQALEALKTTS